MVNLMHARRETYSEEESVFRVPFKFKETKTITQLNNFPAASKNIKFSTKINFQFTIIYDDD